MIQRLSPVLALLALLAPLPAGAGALSDLLMAPGLFADAPAGRSVAYAEDLTVPDGGTLRDVTGGVVRLEAVEDDGEPALRLVRESDGKPHPVGTFPAGVANPLLLYFLETTVRATAEATGGSPYYIRNRIREALRRRGSRPRRRSRGQPCGDALAFRPGSEPGEAGALRRPRRSACASTPRSRSASSNFRPIPRPARTAIMRRWC